MTGMSIPHPPTSARRVLSLREVAVDHDGHPALRGVSVEACAGRLLVIVGANGSGKSTLLSVASGLVVPRTGSVWRSDGLRIALVPQSTPLPSHLPVTVADIVSMGTWSRLGPWRPARRTDRASVADAIATVELTTLARRPIGSLSGGQRQRAFLAQAIAQCADLILFDEPMAGLDARSRTIIAGVISELTSAGAAVIAATHDPTEFLSIDDSLELADGRAVSAPGPQRAAFARS